MPDASEKLNAFTGALLSSARAEVQAAEAGARDAEAAAAAARDARQAEALRARTEEAAASARSEGEKRLAAAALAQRRALLGFREDCARTVFADVRTRLAAEAASPAYGETLARLLRAAAGAVKDAGPAVVHLRPADMKYAPALRAALPGTKLSFLQDGFDLGGLIVDFPRKHRRADLTFDTALADLDGRYTEIAGDPLEDGNGS